VADVPLALDEDAAAVLEGDEDVGSAVVGSAVHFGVLYVVAFAGEVGDGVLEAGWGHPLEGFQGPLLLGLGAASGVEAVDAGERACHAGGPDDVEDDGSNHDRDGRDALPRVRLGDDVPADGYAGRPAPGDAA
jgi:hypothetical protein